MITPLGSLILVKEIEETEKVSKSGFIISSSSSLSDLKRGEVVALGTGDRDQSGNTHKIPLEVGDTVLYSEHNATEVIDNGETYKFINWNQLFGKSN
jgi:chaperonin GroES